MFKTSYDKMASVKKGSNMNNTIVARELVAVAKDLLAFRMHYDPIVEMRPAITRALRTAMGLSGDSMRANPVFSQLMTFESFRDSGDSDHPSSDSNKFHYFAIYKDLDTGEFVGGNVWGRIGYIQGEIEVARGDERYVRNAVLSKMATKRAKGYQEAKFMQ